MVITIKKKIPEWYDREKLSGGGRVERSALWVDSALDWPGRESEASFMSVYVRRAPAQGSLHLANSVTILKVLIRGLLFLLLLSPTCPGLADKWDLNDWVYELDLCDDGKSIFCEREQQNNLDVIEQQER